MNIISINVLCFNYMEEKLSFNVEVTEGLEVTNTSTQKLTTEELKGLCNEGNIEVSYKEDKELEALLQKLECGYIEVQLNANGSGEHKVKSHEFKFTKGELKRDNRSKNLKTCKRAGTAIRFAQSFGKKVVMN